MSISGVSYQQVNQVYQNSQQTKTENRKETGKTASKSDKVKVSEWKPVSEGSSLAPTKKGGIRNCCRKCGAVGQSKILL